MLPARVRSNPSQAGPVWAEAWPATIPRRAASGTRQNAFMNQSPCRGAGIGAHLFKRRRRVRDTRPAGRGGASGDDALQEMTRPRSALTTASDLECT
jgi:hypothetical protein